MHDRAAIDGVKLVVVRRTEYKDAISFQVVIGVADGADHIVSLSHITFHGVHAGLAVVGGAHRHPFGQQCLTQFHIVDHVSVVCLHHNPV